MSLTPGVRLGPYEIVAPLGLPTYSSKMRSALNDKPASVGDTTS